MSSSSSSSSPQRVLHSKKMVRCVAIWVIVVLVSINVSTATRSPLNPPNVIIVNNNYDNDNGNTNINSAIGGDVQSQHTLRGGSTTLQPPPPPLQRDQQQQQEQQKQGLESSRAFLEQQMHYHQQQLQQQQHQPMGNSIIDSNNNNNNDPQERTPAVAPTAFLPKISLKQFTKALLHTSEWNRKFLKGVKHWGRRELKQLASTSSSPQSVGHHSTTNHPQQWLPNNNDNHQQLQHHVADQRLQQQDYRIPNGAGNNNLYGSLPVNVHPSRMWHPPIEASSGRSLEEEELTLFHAKLPQEESPKHQLQQSSLPQDNEAQSWGPDLLPYLKHIAEVLQMDLSINHAGADIELVLAMIYLDRACSVDTPRSNGVPPCPFCEPRTVHRLGLAALVVAKTAVSSSNNGGSENPETVEGLVVKLSLSLGIPKEQLQQMVEWMVVALGDDGMYVGLEDLRNWGRTWGSFVSSSASN